MKDISASDTLDQINEGKVISIIDVRELIEVRAGIIPGATHIPLGELVSRVREIKKNHHEHIIVCRSGNRSKAAAGYLDSIGYNVANMSGGMEDWKGKVV